MAAMSPEAQALGVLQQEMAETRAQVTHLTNSHEALKSAHDALNLAAQQALADKDQKIHETEIRLRNLLLRQQFAINKTPCHLHINFKYPSPLFFFSPSLHRSQAKSQSQIKGIKYPAGQQLCE